MKHPTQRRLAVEALEPRCLLAVAVELFADVNNGTQDSLPRDLVEWNDDLFFFAKTSLRSSSFWRHDPDSSETTQLAETAGHAGYLTPAGGNLLFWDAADNGQSSQLWASDGTADGTQPLLKWNVSVNDPVRSGFYPLGDAWAFRARSDEGIGLWLTDGTAAGTHAFHHSVYLPDYLTSAGDQLFFSLSTPDTGYEVWKTDGTSGGTTMIADLNPGENTSFPDSFTVLDDIVFFTADVEETGRELYRTDGTAAGTWLVKDIRSGDGGSEPSNLTAVDGQLYFTALDEDANYELWRSDGTTDGTERVTGFVPSRDGRINRLTAHQDQVTFVTYASFAPPKLWVADGASASSVAILPEFLQGEFFSLNGALWFSGGDQQQPGKELWTSDLTQSGTRRVSDLEPGWLGSDPLLFEAVELGDQVFFPANPSAVGYELFQTDGTAAGTSLVADLNTNTEDSGARYFKDAGEQTFFFANHEKQASLWITNAGAPGVSKLTPVSHFDEQTLTVVGERLFFVASGNDKGLWTSDGTADGTELITTDDCGWLTEVNNHLMVFCEGELWISDGTWAGTKLVKDLAAEGVYLPWYSEAVAFGDQLIFTAKDEDHGFELWQSDGTTDGTRLLKDIDPGPEGGGVGSLKVVHNLLYFTAVDEQHGFEPWRSDGTPDGTFILRDITAGSDGFGMAGAWPVGDRVLFTTYTDQHGRELWSTDGTADGTQLVVDSVAGRDAWKWFPERSASDGDRLWIVRESPTGVPSLWTSDGTAAGTSPLRDFERTPSPFGSSSDELIEDLTVVDGVAYFSADDGVTGRELWSSDGTETGTTLVTDLVPGRDSSSPGELAATQHGLLFAATTDDVGREPRYLVPVQAPWQNPFNALDVNDDDLITPLDVLIPINRLNRDGPGTLPHPDQEPRFFPDVNGDNALTPLDPLIVINFINGGAGGEAELIAPVDLTFDLDWLSHRLTPDSWSITDDPQGTSEAGDDGASWPAISSTWFVGLDTGGKRVQPINRVECKLPNASLKEQLAVDQCLSELTDDVLRKWIEM